jgi:hypothetical protein
MNRSLTMKDLPVGTRIFNSGDRCNAGGFGVIVKHHPNARFGDNVEIRMDMDEEPIIISPTSFSEQYLGHCGTRFVTEAAYRRWRSERMAQFHNTR